MFTGGVVYSEQRLPTLCIEEGLGYLSTGWIIDDVAHINVVFGESS